MVDRRVELDRLLEAIAYELTSARSFGLGEPDALRNALRKANDLLEDAIALAGDARAIEREASD